MRQNNTKITGKNTCTNILKTLALAQQDLKIRGKNKEEHLTGEIVEHPFHRKP